MPFLNPSEFAVENGNTLVISETSEVQIKWNFHEHSCVLQWFSSLHDILKNFAFIGMGFKLSKTDDLSGLGVEMEWMTPGVQIEEAFDYHPGIVVTKEEFFPFGRCMEGSGDPYFLKTKSDNINVYRILHEYHEYSDEMVQHICTLEELVLKNVERN